MNKRSIGLIAVVLLSFFGALSVFMGGGSDAMPISAESMSEQERAEIDATVLAEGLSDFVIDDISINYSGDVISVYIDKKTSEQYAENYANDVVDAIKSVLNTRKSDMTFEKDRYSVMIYGTDGLIKIAST